MRRSIKARSNGTLYSMEKESAGPVRRLGSGRRAGMGIAEHVDRRDHCTYGAGGHASVQSP